MRPFLAFALLLALSYFAAASAVLVLLALLSLSGCDSSHACTPSSPPREHPLTGQELQAREGHAYRVRGINDAVARVASGDPALHRAVVEIALAYHRLASDEEWLARAARTDRGLPETVALVQSGIAWVETASR